MEDDPHKNGLYRWQRQTKPKVQSRSHRVKSSNDIQDWIKKVEEASTNATDVAFGLTAPTATGKQKGKIAAQVRAEHVRHYEGAYSEAQQLLNQWVTEKVRFDDDDGYDDLEAWRRARQNRQAAIAAADGHSRKDSEDFSLERLTQLALEDEFEIDEAAIYERVKKSALGESDPYANLYEMELPDAVDSVLKNMLSKDVVKDTFKKKIGLDEEPPPDPRTKMELRHQMVKENRERRQREEDKRRSEASMKKEARLAAQKLILKEQKEREQRARHEDQQLKKEMTRIRKEMHEDRKRKEEEMTKKREEKEALERLARKELERQTAVEQREMIESHKQESDRRKKLLLKREMLSARIASLNLQCLHRHFTAWYDLVLSRRLLLGKVKAMADWKLMLRVWGAWRSHVRGRRLEIETEMHERNIIEAERHKLLADRHFCRSILSRCMIAWQRFAAESVQKRELEEEQLRTKNKMASLLSAVAEGKLGGMTARSEVTNNSARNDAPMAGGPSVAFGRSVQSAKTHTKPVENAQQEGKKKQAWLPGQQSSVSNSNNNIRTPSPAMDPSSPSKHKSPISSGKGTPIPSEPWQVTRQHLNLTKEQIAQLGGEWHEEEGEDRGDRPHSEVEIRRRFGTQPWMNRQFVPNSFEHRYTAQQVALKEQQAQIREQRRLIEELQYEQRQQAYRQRLLPGSGTPPPLPPPLPEPEVPLQGKQIPRDDDRLVQENGHNKVTPPGKGQSSTPTSQVRHHILRSPLPQNLPDQDSGGYTDRCGLPTDRSDLTSATSATHTSLATASTHNSKYLKVLKNMEDRAAERARIKAEREERRRLQEEEKAAQLQQEEEERQKQLEAEKKAKIEAYRQKKRLEKQREEEKQRQQARQEELTKLADAHYTRAILKYRGLLPIKKLISLAKRNWLKAVRHHERSLVRQCLQAWRQFADEEMERKAAVADQMRDFILTKRCFLNWRHYKYHQHFLERRAQKHHNEVLRLKAFQAWVAWVQCEREESRRMDEEAGKMFIRNLIKKCFVGWRDLPAKLKREEEKQKRKSNLRKRVAELIPDFSPAEQTSALLTESEDHS
ncbi:coiled-coil domain-containing 191 [Plakobranchus ocellatus]|uniref:Coiled-coil domain-containing 191 n=1 Tax=Plakobranchus ocellatus TaxID=259542 RepID=A0AAV3ZY18_9GAST|nr:coiled-coil domain-containing 191 [Plakobranchus ocellatus]